MINEYLKNDKEEVKQVLLDAMDTFNIEHYYVPIKTKLKVMEFVDSDKNTHIILVDENIINMKEDVRLLDQKLALFYQSIYNGGIECMRKAKMFRRLGKSLSRQFNLIIDDITLVSFSFVLNPNINNMCRLSQFWYIVYELVMREQLSE